MRQRVAVLGGLFLVLFVGLLVVPPERERQVPMTVYSAEPGGGKALRLWLESLGHRVTTLEGDRYTIGRDVSTVLVLSPSQRLDAAALGELERWTRQGGRLIVSAETLRTWELLRRFDVLARPLSGVTEAVPAAPGRLDPALGMVAVTPGFEVVPGERAAGAVPLLVGQGASGDERQPILAVSIPVDRGELIVTTVTSALSNEGLRDEANARLALSLIGPPGRGQIAFDELHHGFGSLERRHIYALLLEQSWGRVSLLVGGVMLLFLLLRGRRLGRAVPVFVDRGRSLGELVTSQAGLYRAGGKRAFVAEHLARQLRHDLAQALGLPGDASDHQIADRASALGRDPSEALRLLTETRRASSDRALLALTRDGERARAALSGVTAPPAGALHCAPTGAERGSQERRAARTPR